MNMINGHPLTKLLRVVVIIIQHNNRIKIPMKNVLSSAINLGYESLDRVDFLINLNPASAALDPGR